MNSNGTFSEGTCVLRQNPIFQFTNDSLIPTDWIFKILKIGKYCYKLHRILLASGSGQKVGVLYGVYT